MIDFPEAGRLGIVVMLAAMLSGCVSAGMDVSGPVEPRQAAKADAGAGEQWLIPSTQAGFLMRARVFRPAGPGPFPLAVINHGSEQDAARRRKAPAPTYPALTDWFLARGYVVMVPVRPGHGNGGKYLEDQGGCKDADYARAGNGAGDSIGAAVAYMQRQPFVRPQGTVVAGHSAGAWGSLAYAARHPAGVRAVVNFSGGRGGHHLNKALNNCAPERLVATAGAFGRQASVPSLWLYAANDTYFPPALSQAMAEAFRGEGGRAEFHLFPARSGEGHFLIQGTEWGDVLQRFLDAAPGG
jgi:dienelactone hydrolase